MDETQPDYLFAHALITALASALRLTSAEDAAQLSEVCSEPKAAPGPDDVVIPYGCVRYAPYGRSPRIQAQLSIGGSKKSLGYYPYTHAGAAEADRIRRAAAVVRDAGGDEGAVRAAARAAGGE